jgi:oxygen-dependent protoporphyrinogen oxidase
LVAFAERGSLLEQGAAIPTTYDVPVFAGIPGGMGTWPHRLVDDLPGVTVRTGVTVRELTRTPGGWRLVTGPTTAPEVVDASAVVLATPAAPTARLLGDVAPTASAELAGIEHASMVVVTFAFAAGDVAGLDATGSSGFLVPPTEGRRIKASTFSFAKWGWVREAGAAAGVAHLRTSLGRHREEATLQASDEELVAWSLADLAEATGLRAVPVDTHVQRWGGGLPQYAVGHLDAVARIRAGLPEGVVVAGAAYDGVGIPAVIASAQRAVADLLAADSSSSR